MERYLVLFLLCGLMCAVCMAAPRAPEALEPVQQELQETAGSGDNSAEVYMNALEERAKLWWQSIMGDRNGTDYTSEAYEDY